MKPHWPTVPLGEVLQERQETPSADALASGKIRIVSKIGFNDGTIQLRSDGKTKTGMILIRPGDLVVSGINAGKGAIAIYGEENGEPVAATIHYGAYIPNKDRVNVRFLWWLLRSGTFRELLLQYVPGGIKTELKATCPEQSGFAPTSESGGAAVVSQKKINPMEIPLPPLPKQRRLVGYLDGLAGQVAALARLQSESHLRLEQLLPSILDRAFKGELSHARVLTQATAGHSRRRVGCVAAVSFGQGFQRRIVNHGWHRWARIPETAFQTNPWNQCHPWLNSEPLPFPSLAWRQSVFDKALRGKL
jgi:type I restriction enzyme S subunit